MIAYLDLADYLLIAERVLGLPAEVIANFNRIGLAESALAAPQAGFGGVEAYPDFGTKAAVLCWQNDGTLAASIVDPHGDHLADARAKLRALAAFAARFDDSVRAHRVDRQGG